MKPEYAPIGRDSRMILRQKTLLGETYIELAPGRSSEELADGGRLPEGQVEPTVELDEVFSAFDKPTREFFGGWVREVDRAVAGSRGQGPQRLARQPGRASRWTASSCSACWTSAAGR